jgi:Fe-S oxidoreductase
VYDAPRAVSGATIEMERSRNKSFCCGGGGGMSFVDEPADQRVNQERANEAVASGAEVLATGCPFCMTQMEDGVRGRMKVMDLAEVLWSANGPEPHA